MLRRYPLLFLCLAAASGIIIADHWSALLTLAGLLLVPLLWPGRKNRSPCLTVMLACLVATAGYAWRHHHIIQRTVDFPLAQALKEGREIPLSGTGWILSEPRHYDSGFSCHMEITSFETAGHPFAYRHRVPVWVDQPGLPVAYGTEWRFTGILTPFEKQRAPGAFDPGRFYFRELGAAGQLQIHHGDQLESTGVFRGSRLVAHAWKLRRIMEDILRLGVAPEDQVYADVVTAMSLGAREQTPEDVEEHFRLSGTLHLFAVSGLHVAVVGSLLLGAAHLLRIPKRRAAFILIPMILYYAVLTGLSPSAVRSSIMFALILGACVIKERSRLLNNLGLAGLVLMAWDTQTLFMPGFQLSFVVVFFIAVLTQPTRGVMLEKLAPDPFIPRSLLPRWRVWLDHAAYQFCTAFAISLVSWLGSLLLLVWHFQNISLIGIAANLVMVPISSFIIILSTVSLCLAGFGLGWLVMAVNRFNILCTILFTWLGQFFAELPASNWNANWFDRDHLRSPVIESPPLHDRQPMLRLDIMGDRGENAVLASFYDESDTPQAWLLDTGGRYTLQRQLLPLLAYREINHLSGILLSHGDSRHIGSAPHLISRFRPRLLLQSDELYHTPVYQEIARLAQRRGMTVTTLKRGDTLKWNPASQISVLAPDPSHPGRIADDRCLVLMWRCANWNILFTHDSGFHTEHLLMERATELGADIWIRGQHSEQPSGQDFFIEAVRPRLIISSHSSFPAHERLHPGFVESLRKRQIPLLDHQQNGLVTLEFYLEGVLVIPHTNSDHSLFLTKD